MKPRLLVLAALALMPWSASFAADTPKATPPRLISSETPAYPATLREEGIVGKTEISVLIDEEGIPRDLRLEFASLPEFGPPALEAVKSCRFVPAQIDGKPVARRFTIPIDFGLTDAEIEDREARRLTQLLASSVPLISMEEIDAVPEVTKFVKTRFPAEITAGNPSGEALVGLVVDESGRILDLHVITTTNRAYGAASLDAIGQWSFSPGRLNGQVVRTRLRIIMNFSPENPELAGPRLKPGVAHYVPERDERRFPAADPKRPKLKMPKHIDRKPPTLPASLARSSGRATVEFVINSHGIVTHVRCVRTSHSAFGVEAERAISYWRFSPATLDGRPIAIRANQELIFGR